MFRQAVRSSVRITGTQLSRNRNFSCSIRKRPQSAFCKMASAVAAMLVVGTTVSENAGFFSTTVAPTDFKKVREDIVSAIEAEDAKRNDGTSIGPTLVRLAWHTSGTYSIFDKTGGSNGSTMRFKPESEWRANAGLDVARTFLEQITKKHPQLSVADAWTLAGVVAIEHMGGPTIPWRQGRTDAATHTSNNSLPNVRLPNADMGCPHASNSHLRNIFGRMGFNDREIVALCGAHAIGRCHVNASGYWGPWTRAETTFSNEYYNVLLCETWTQKSTHEGKPWTGPLQYESKDHSLMMLPADIALLEDKEFRQYVELYSKDEALFFKDFSAAYAKLLELGVPFEK